MTQTLQPELLSEASRSMYALKDVVLAEWEQRTRKALQDAKKLYQPVIINTIPTFYDNIVEALTPGLRSGTAISSTTLAAEHGGERARLTNYDPRELVLEYQIFRTCLFEVLEQNGVRLDSHDLRVVNTSIDDAIREAVTAFSLVLTALREQFIAALTHDMRSPLSAATMAAELIILTTDSSRTRELAERIHENVTRVDSMIEGLLDSMVFQAGEKLRLKLSHFDMLEVAREVGRDATHAGTLMRVIGESVFGWWARDAVKRALENLVGNARKYGAPETPITIKVDTLYGGRLALTVHNDGPPIPVEEQEAIFQIFRRAREAKTGTKKGWGIGLPYVRAVAESHGGSVAVESRNESGTTIHIDLPIDCRPFQGAPTVANPG